MKNIVCLISALFMLAACQNQNGGFPTFNKADMGTVLGGAAGAWAGSSIGKGSGRIVATAAGTLLGAALGRSIGDSMDKVDLQYYDRTSQKALEQGQPGQTFPWSNPQSGVSGTVTPSGYYQNAQGKYCREYTQTITVGGRVEEGYGVACRQPDGSWQIQG